MNRRYPKGRPRSSKQQRTQRFLVAVFDPDFSRRRRIVAALVRCGAWIADGEKSTAELQLAAVALKDNPAADAPALLAMEKFQRAGVPVICYADGAIAWPLALRCIPLLNGASDLLDCSLLGFTQEFEDRVVQSWRQREAARQAEEAIIHTMQDFGLMGRSPAMRALFRTVFRVGKLSDVPVLLTGETGTGKGLLAAAIHRLDPKRSSGPFVALNCGAISAGVAESELFGHRRGAFTGADRDRKGLFRAAEGGVLFLDELAELSPPLQVKLLRALEQRRVLGVGEEQEVAVNVRVIAATNRDLGRMVSAGTFAADLFYRIKVLPLEVPPLRERRADVPILVRHFLQKHCHLGPGAVSASDEFLETLAFLDLPGNVRELEHIICQALIQAAPGRPLGLRDLPAEVWRQLSGERHVETKNEPNAGHAQISLKPGDWRLTHFLDHCEKLLLKRALRQTQGNQSQAARLLGITVRSVYNKLRKHQLRA